MKAIPLIIANLKGFVRNWKTVVLLMVFPFVLISVVFLSFSQNMMKVPVGIVTASQSPEYGQFKNDFNKLVELKEYDKLDDCISQINQYNQYLCIEIISKEDSYTINIFYDNTREPIIWQVLQIIQLRIDTFQKQKSKEMIGELIGGYGQMGNELQRFNSEILLADDVLGDYISQTDLTILKLTNAKTELSATLDSIDSDITSASMAEQQLRADKDYYYYSATNQISSVRNNLNLLSGLEYPYTTYASSAQSSVSSASNLLEDYNDEADSSFNEIEMKINSYKVTSQRGRVYVAEIDTGITQLQNTKYKLHSYRNELSGLRSELSSLSSVMGLISNISPERIANPFITAASPSYLPKVSQKDLERYGQVLTQAEQEAKGFNLLGLQTIFPTMLLLIVMFLSLLISSFICLNEVNCPAKIRLGLIHRSFMPEFISTYISSLLIISVPLGIVVFLGGFLFRLAIFQNFIPVILSLLLLCNIFILIGMGLAYLLRKESMTLVITTFLLLFILFISGFILPIERMSAPAQFLANIAPGKVTLNAFNQAVFYNQGLFIVRPEIFALLAWSISLLALALLIKKLKKSNID